VSIERSPSDAARRRTGLNTIEGMGTSVGPEVNPDALDSRRGRQGYQDVTASAGRVLSPNRAMGARSVIQEETKEEQAQQTNETQA
jgi:hypothetical protein